MRVLSWAGVISVAGLIAGCGGQTEEKAVAKSEEPVPIVVPAEFVGSWDSGDCQSPSVRIGTSDIQHFYAEVASPLTAAEASPDGRLVLTWADEGEPTTDTFQLSDGKLDHISTVSASSNDQWQSEPMTRCAGT